MQGKAKFTAKDLTVMTHMKREFVLYQVEQNELDRLVAGYTSLHLSFFGITIGAAVTILVAWPTSSLSPPRECLFLAVLAATMLMALYFGLMSKKDHALARTTAEKSRGQSTPVS
jgi:uncharacterized protein YacL